MTDGPGRGLVGLASAMALAALCEQASSQPATKDLARRAQELRGLQAELVRPPTKEWLRSWTAKAADLRAPLLKDTIWGTIRWKKSIGRSLGPTLASGFQVEHWYLAMNWGERGDGSVKDLSKWVQSAEPPSLWDLPDDGDYHQVGYLCYGARALHNAVIVRFSKQSWDPPGRVHMKTTRREIRPTRQEFLLSETDFVVLYETTVVEVPIRMFH